MSRSFRCSEAQFAFGVALLVTSVYAFLVSTKSVHALAPFGTYEQVFQYSDGQISVNQTAQLYLSSEETGGEFDVGEHTVRVQSVPPRLLYRAREVGRIPRSVRLHTEEICLVVSREDAEALESAKRPPAPPASDPQAAANRRLLATTEFLTQHDLDGESYAQTAFYQDRCKELTYFDADNGARTLVQDPTFRAKITALYDNLRADHQHVVIRESTYMRRIKQHMAGYGGVLLDGWLDRDAVIAEMVLISQMYIDVLTPEQSEWRRVLGCTNLYGRCYTYKFMEMGVANPTARMSNPSEECRTSPNPPASCEFNVHFVTLPNGQPARYKYPLPREMFLEIAPAQLLCKPIMSDAATFGAGNGGGTGKYDLNDIINPFVTAFGAYADGLKNSVNAQIDLNVKNSEWAKSAGLALEMAANVTAKQDEINKQSKLVWDEQEKINTGLNLELAGVSKAMALINSKSNESFTLLSEAIRKSDERLGELNLAQSIEVNKKFNMTLQAVAGVASIQSGQFQQLYNEIRGVSDMLQAVNAQLSAYIQQKQYNRLITQSFYRSLDLLGLDGSGLSHAPENRTHMGSTQGEKGGEGRVREGEEEGA